MSNCLYYIKFSGSASDLLIYNKINIVEFCIITAWISYTLVFDELTSTTSQAFYKYADQIEEKFTFHTVFTNWVYIVVKHCIQNEL